MSPDFIEVTKYSYVIGAFLGAIILYFTFFYRRENLPGPWGLPYFGLYPFIKPSYSADWAELAKNRYGDVFFLKITGQLYVHLASLEVIHEAHVKKADCFPERSGRYSVLKAIFDKGIVLDKGESWRVHRKFFVQTLREIASKEALSGPVAEAVQSSLKGLSDSGQQPIRISYILSQPCVKAVSQMCFGPGNEDLIPGLTFSYEKLVPNLGGPMSLITGEFARYFILPWYSGYRNMFKEKREMKSLLSQIIARRESAIRSGDLDNNLVDRYLHEKELRRRKGDPQAKFFNEASLVPTLAEIFGDGSVSISFIIAFLLGDLAYKTEVQEKMRQEMHELLGDNLEVLPTLDDKARLPYVNAVIKELFRCLTFTPTLASLKCERETTVGGFRVPKGCVTMVNGYAANRDPRVFDNPSEFRPERFLGSFPKEGQSSQQRQPFLFGIGKRACAGEFLTTMMIFCFITGIIRNFVLKPTKEAPKAGTWTEISDHEIFAVPVQVHRCC